MSNFDETVTRVFQDPNFRKALMESMAKKKDEIDIGREKLPWSPKPVPLPTPPPPKK